MRTLIAGFGNVLRGDDGFGVAVLQQLGALGPLGDGIDLLEVGTGGLRLAQELLAGYDRVIVVDAMTAGGEPGALYVRRVESIEPATDVDLHLAVPARALSVAQALGALPAEVFLVGCEPKEVEELRLELSPPVRRAVPRAIASILALLAAPMPRAGVRS